MALSIGGNGKLYDQHDRQGALLNCKWGAGRLAELQKDKPACLILVSKQSMPSGRATASGSGAWQACTEVDSTPVAAAAGDPGLDGRKLMRCRTRVLVTSPCSKF
eukprot:3723578-Pleurochrysis_carterae.AAC.2